MAPLHKRGCFILRSALFKTLSIWRTLNGLLKPLSHWSGRDTLGVENHCLFLPFCNAWSWMFYVCSPCALKQTWNSISALQPDSDPPDYTPPLRIFSHFEFDLHNGPWTNLATSLTPLNEMLFLAYWGEWLGKEGKSCDANTSHSLKLTRILGVTDSPTRC